MGLVNGCFEDAREKYYSHSKESGKEVMRSCLNLAKRSPEKKAKICKRTETSSGGIQSAKHVCPITCETCPGGSCEEFTSNKFFNYKSKKGKIKYRTCGWLRGVREGGDHVKADKVCDKAVPSFPIAHP